MSEKHYKICHDGLPDTKIVSASEFEELEEDPYEHWHILRVATEGEVRAKQSTPTPGPHVQSFEENNESSELSTMKNENAEVVVELSNSEDKNSRNEEELLEIADPYSDRAERFFEEEELSRIRSAHDEEQNGKSVEGKSSQDVISEIESELKERQAQHRKEKRREKVRDKVENWDPRFGTKVEKMSAEAFSELMANAQDGKTLEDQLEEEVESILEEEEESEEELSPDPDPETAKEAVETWGSERYENTAFEEFARSIQEENDIQGEEVEELESEPDSTPVETHVKKHGNGNATVESNDPEIKSELRDVEFAEILNESGDMVEAKVTDYRENMGE